MPFIMENLSFLSIKDKRCKILTQEISIPWFPTKTSLSYVWELHSLEMRSRLLTTCLIETRESTEFHQFMSLSSSLQPLQRKRIKVLSLQGFKDKIVNKYLKSLDELLQASLQPNLKRRTPIINAQGWMCMCITRKTLNKRSKLRLERAF